MTSKEAIDKLEHLINSPVGREEIDETCFEVMKYLAAQESRVMTLEEVERSYSKAPIWLEESRLQTVYPAIYHKTKGPEDAKFADITDFYYQRQDWAYGTYGKTWRCWTSPPSKEEMEATPWN